MHVAPCQTATFTDRIVLTTRTHVPDVCTAIRSTIKKLLRILKHQLQPGVVATTCKGRASEKKEKGEERKKERKEGHAFKTYLGA